MTKKDYTQPVDDEVYYNIKDLQRIFQCGRDKTYALVKIPGFPGMIFGNQILSLKSEVHKWIEKNHSSGFSDYIPVKTNKKK